MYIIHDIEISLGSHRFRLCERVYLCIDSSIINHRTPVSVNDLIPERTSHFFSFYMIADRSAIEERPGEYLSRRLIIFLSVSVHKRHLV